ncbi:MAG: hypothetical protein ACR2OR_09210 [Hyphomicrobiales bacterium]
MMVCAFAFRICDLCAVNKKVNVLELFFMKIFLSLPTADGKLEVKTSYSNTSIRLMLQNSGIPSDETAISNSETVEARNVIAHGFLDSDATHLLTVDSDMKVDPMFVKKMIELRKPFIGVATPARGIDLEKFYENSRKYDDFQTAYVNTLKFVGSFSESVDKDAEFIKADYVGGGLVLVSREVFKSIIESGQVESVGPRHMISEFHYGFYNQLWRDELQNYHSEDFSFCERWRRVGGEIWCYVGPGIGHIGSVMFEGTYRDRSFD